MVVLVGGHGRHGQTCRHPIACPSPDLAPYGQTTGSMNGGRETMPGTIVVHIGARGTMWTIGTISVHEACRGHLPLVRESQSRQLVLMAAA